jgi:anti-anti-sigma factor
VAGETRATEGSVVEAVPDPRDLVVSGEIDIVLADELATRLAQRLFLRDDVVVDVGALSFIDVSGCRAIIRAAKALPEGRRLVLANATSQLVKTLSVCGWADHPQLVLSEGPACGLGTQRGCA